MRAEPTALRRRLWGFGLVLLALVGLALAWKWSPLNEWLQVDRVVELVRRWGTAIGPVAGAGVFALALVLAVPLTPLTLVTLAALGPWAGMACAYAGALLGAAASYALGRWMGYAAVHTLGGERTRALSARLARDGLWAVVAVRMVPVAPFAVVNLLMGATHLRLRHLLVGTALGMTPSTVAMALFGERLLAALRAPGPWAYTLLGLTVLLVVLGGWGLKRWFQRQ